LTKRADEEIDRIDILNGLRRHSHGDWNDLEEESIKENNFSVENGFRILSSYKTRNNIKFWIITEADRSYTTILLPEEY
jgi:hypothetical protein